MRTPNFVLENLKYQGEFEVGMKVKAFDHQPGVPGREDKYIEGEIIAVDAESKSQPGSMGYHVKVEKDTLFTKNSRVGKTVFVPYEISMDYDNRITSARPDDEDEAKAMSNMEGKMSDIALDMKQLSDAEFQKKYSKTKEEMKASMSEDEVEEGADKNRAIRIDKMMRANGMDTLADLLADAMHFAEITGLDFGAEVDKAKGYYDDADQQEEGSEKAKPDYIDIDGDGDKV